MLDNLELQAAINKYCDLCPDLFARSNYNYMFEEDSSKLWNPLFGWQWLLHRMTQDKNPLINLDGSANFDNRQNWWDSWENEKTF